MLTRKEKESYRLDVVKSLLDFVYVIVFQQNKEAERLLLTKKKYFFFENIKKFKRAPHHPVCQFDSLDCFVNFPHLYLFTHFRPVCEFESF